jgi:hypothetical protein
MGMSPQVMGSHLYLEGIPAFCQSDFEFTSDVIYNKRNSANLDSDPLDLQMNADKQRFCKNVYPFLLKPAFIGVNLRLIPLFLKKAKLEIIKTPGLGNPYYICTCFREDFK